MATPSASIAHSSPAPSVQTGQLIEHPTGATDVVLRMYRTGGFLYPGTTIDEAPIFTLYGDRRVIYTVERSLPAAGLQRELHLAQLTESQVLGLLENALGGGGLALARERYADVPVADASTTNFEINAGGFHKRVAVYALGDFEAGKADAAARAAFEELAQALSNFNVEVEAGNVVDLGVYQPEAFRATIFPDDVGELRPAGEWPWPDIDPADFERDNSGFGRLVITPEQAAAALTLPVGEIGDPVVPGGDGVNYLVRIRPLLPDELP